MPKTKVLSVAMIEKPGYRSRIDNGLYFSTDIDEMAQNIDTKQYTAVCPKGNKAFPDNNLFFMTLLPYLRYMQLTGIFYLDTKSSGGWLRWGFGKIYCFCLIIFIWILFASFAVPTIMYRNYFNFNEISTAILASAWILQSCLAAVVLFWICSHGKIVNSLFAVWDQLMVSEREKRQIAENVAKIRNLVLAFAILIHICNAIGFILMFQGLIPSFGKFAALPMDRMFSPSVAKGVLTFWTFGLCIVSPGVVQPTALFVLVCLTISKTLDQFNQSLNLTIKKLDMHGHAFNTEYFRLKYQKILQMVKLADDNFGPFLLFMYICNLGVLTFSVYRVMFVSNFGIVQIMEIFHACGSLGLIGALSFACVKVNSVAHKVLEDLYAVSTINMNHGDLMQVVLFANRLTGPPVGLTGWGLFMVTKDFLLTSVGVFLSYFFLIIQFSTTSSKCQVIPVASNDSTV